MGQRSSQAIRREMGHSVQRPSLMSAGAAGVRAHAACPRRGR